MTYLNLQKLRYTINDYAPTTRWQVAKTWSVSPGSHVWELRLNGSGSYLDSDAITINTSYLGSGSYDDSDITPSSYVGSWTHYSGTGPYNNGVYFTKTTENAVKFTFSGSSITYVFTKATNRGKAAVTIDGIDKGVLDLYFGSTQWQQSKTYDNLGSGIHTIHIAVSGDKNINSTDYYIDLDRFIVQ